LHGWLRSGNCGSARGAVEFLKEALALLPEKHAIRVVRADAGFLDQPWLGFLEQRGLSYIVVARLTRWLKRHASPRGVLWTSTTRWANFLCNCGAGTVRAASW